MASARSCAPSFIRPTRLAGRCSAVKSAPAPGAAAPAALARQQRRQRPVVCRAAQSTGTEAAQLLDQFWMARGVVDEQQRRALVAAAGSIQAEQDLQAFEAQQLELPSASAYWYLEQQLPGGGGQAAYGGAGSDTRVSSSSSAGSGASSAVATSPEVAAVSRRILALQQLLGGGGVDVVWMLVREPRLLSADFRSITQRLFDMKVAEGSEGLDVVGLVEQQPALLLQAGARVSSDETAAERLQAWQHGLVSDNSTEWARRYSELQAYVERHGDAHVGFRDGDDAELARWATKQRAEHRGGQLAEPKQAALEAAGFEWDGERAEWLRWYNEIQAFKRRHGHCQPQPLAHPNDFLLINWCSVQRIMRRCGVLPEERVAALDGLGFDWTGADPLS